VLIDEATAHIDRDTEQQIQRVIRTALPACTVITIAHRMYSLEEYDHVLVLDKGAIVHQGSPRLAFDYFAQ
jgi:ABC-type bacteriocin/lantibiotic exporter with double-glycine peptidase domain